MIPGLLVACSLSILLIGVLVRSSPRTFLIGISSSVGRGMELDRGTEPDRGTEFDLAGGAGWGGAVTGKDGKVGVSISVIGGSGEFCMAYV